ncbi:MAG: aspartate carbamoyltransferase [Actinomycetaceae bacterium]|nr:aspartate carbamoyltransferase [Actinomycetaceae bacterium]
MNDSPKFPKFGPGQHLISVDQFDKENLREFFTMAQALRPIAERKQICTVLDGAVLCSLFFEPSTRTRLSFESAFLRLGGEVETTTGFTFSSMAKGESIADTSRVVSGYTDVLVVRHPDAGSVAEFAQHSVVPVLNAGDGSGEHPSQALLDVFTMEAEMEKKGRTIDGCTIAVMGDLKYGRTVHSLMKLMSLYDNVTFQLYAPPSLELPHYVSEYATQSGSRVIECSHQIEALSGSDIVYATRVQRERMTEEIAKSKELQGCLLNRAMLEEANALDIIICHPLPRDSRPDSFDLATDVDDLPGLSIFRQTDNGVLVRMAMFLTTMGVSMDIVAAKTKAKPWKVTD